MNNTEICQSALQARNTERLNTLNNLFELGVVAMTSELQAHRDLIESAPTPLTEHEINLAVARDRTALLFARFNLSDGQPNLLREAINTHCANARLLQSTL